MMEVLVIGLGSMGRRRIRLLQKFQQVEKIVGVDKKVDRRDRVEENFDCKTYPSIDEAFQKEPKIQCVFVCTSPLSHDHLIFKALHKGCHVFTELNLVANGYAENMALAKQKGKVLFLSSTHFYREEIKFIQSNVKTEKDLNYIYHVGQYLPDWHPWEDYNDFFVKDSRTNGCREIMAIELPWLIATFGKIKDFHVISGNMSNLSVPYKDNYMIQLEHGSGNKGALIIDIVSPKAVRNLEVYGENIYYWWDGSPTNLLYFDKIEGQMKAAHLYDRVEQLEDYSSFVVENAYQDEIQGFLDVLEGKGSPHYGFEDDLNVLGLIDQIEEICRG